MLESCKGFQCDGRYFPLNVDEDFEQYATFLASLTGSKHQSKDFQGSS
jgi:hypothetical protein